MIRTLLAVAVMLASLAGCSRLRFVVDMVPGEDRLGETAVAGDRRSRDKVALIEVSGMIIDSRSRVPFAAGDNPVARFTEALARAEADDRVRAVVLRIDSPGGTVTASDIMYRAARDFRERSGKPVVVQMGSVAASGGYYLACAGDEIVAEPTTITGSIGVIMQMFDVSGGMSKLGIRAHSITSGPNKAAGSPFEPMEPAQRAIFQGIVDEFYASFVGVVSSRRPVSAEHIEAVTDGRVVTGRHAAEVGLVDRIGGLEVAFAAAKRHAGIPSARLVKYHRPVEFVASPYAAAPAAAGRASLVQVSVDADLRREPGFWYLWDPGAW